MADCQLIGVVGLGTMGSGIAYTAALHGCDVRCLDADPAVAQQALASLRQQADQRLAAGKLTHRQHDEIFGRIKLTPLAELRDCDLVVEAIREDLPAKRKLFSELDGICLPRTILASNTSSIAITSIADGMKNPGRIIGMHFFNPAQVMPLVEVIPGEKTDHAATVGVFALARALEKTPVRAKDRPGFIANRVARPFYLESLALLERGVADIKTIDDALRNAGYPMGPFELIDLIGLDVNLAVSKSVWEGFDKPARFQPSAIQEKLVGAGKLGRKSGRGFYDYSSGANSRTPSYEVQVKGLPQGAIDNAAFKEFCNELGMAADDAGWIYARVVSAVINEGAQTVGEGTARARDVDLAMTLGLRYPEGPMTIADRVGLDVVLKLLKSFESDSPSGRHTPSKALLDLNAKGDLGEKSAVGFLRHSL